ncbi:MAG: AAA family ATPase, partial [Deltaproteobacteria bacterium]|nr:AAA family ATPase [Deltaproteobacteria bacterium]
LGASKDADLILRALRSGASEFVVNGDDDDLLRAIVRLSHPKADGGSGKIAAIVPAKGGVGTTAIATNLAGVLQAAKSRTCLVDLDLHFGDVLSFLDISSAYSISDLIGNMRRLDAELLDSSLTKHASGVSVLSQSHRLDEAEHINLESISSMLAFLRQHFDAIIVDGIRGFTEVSLAALDVCDNILLICTQDVPSVRNARRCIEIFNQLGYATEKTHVVLNRYTKRSQIDLTVVEETIGLPVAATVANDFPSIIRSVNTGVMLSEVAPRSKLAEDIAALAAIVRGDGAKPRKRGLLSGLFSGKVEAHGA